MNLFNVRRSILSNIFSLFYWMRRTTSTCEDRMHLSSRAKKSNAKCHSCSTVCHILGSRSRKHIETNGIHSLAEKYRRRRAQKRDRERGKIETDSRGGQRMQEKCAFIRWKIQNTRQEKITIFPSPFSSLLYCVHFFLFLLAWGMTLLCVYVMHTATAHTLASTHCWTDSGEWLISFLFCHFDRFFFHLFFGALNTRRNGGTAVCVVFIVFEKSASSLPFVQYLHHITFAEPGRILGHFSG